MKNSATLKTLLVVSGVIASAVGVALLLAPVALYASVGTDVSGKIDLLSDLRATGGALLASGVVIALGAFLANLTFTSLVLSSLLYLAYGSSRLFAMAVDGRPADALIYVAVLEIAIGLANVWALVKYGER